MNVKLRIDERVCTGCGACVDSCPTDVIRMREGKACAVYAEDCQGCFLCEFDCPVEAIRVQPRRYTDNEWRALLARLQRTLPVRPPALRAGQAACRSADGPADPLHARDDRRLGALGRLDRHDDARPPRGSCGSATGRDLDRRSPPPIDLERGAGGGRPFRAHAGRDGAGPRHAGGPAGPELGGGNPAAPRAEAAGAACRLCARGLARRRTGGGGRPAGAGCDGGTRQVPRQRHGRDGAGDAPPPSGDERGGRRPAGRHGGLYLRFAARSRKRRRVARGGPAIRPARGDQAGRDQRQHRDPQARRAAGAAGDPVGQGRHRADGRDRGTMLSAASCRCRAARDTMPGADGC